MLQSKLVVPCVWRETRSERLHGDQLEKRTTRRGSDSDPPLAKNKPRPGRPKKASFGKRLGPRTISKQGGLERRPFLKKHEEPRILRLTAGFQRADVER